MEVFYIKIRAHNRDVRLKVEHAKSERFYKYYEVTARNQVLKLRTNSPLLEHKGLKNFPQQWELILEKRKV